ncbi:MAG TPA: glycosyltransferase family 39 protein [Capillimicrobium sp.]|nr:glycosyltransferase family 39 protein [Capillimicrobium sp.]
MATEAVHAPSGGREGARGLRHALGSPAGWVVAATAISLLVVIWWVASDSRIPSWDPAAHMYRSMQYADAFRAGDLTEWFTSYQTPGYPPLVYLLGAFVSLVLGDGVARFVIVEQLVFLPLLALGTYRIGRLAYGARAGAFAAIFALGCPMIIAQSHVFMLDLPLVAMTAVAGWLVLASGRFEHRGYAFAAGIAFGLGMLTKNLFVLGLAGLVLVALARGGWRNLRGVALFALGIAITGLPWYLAHLDGLLTYALGGTVTGEESIYGADPARWGPVDWQWYLSTALNAQYYLPLWLFGAAGFAWAVARVARRPWRPDDVTPELLTALVLGSIACVALTHNDERYTIALIVWVAVLGTGWFATSGRRALRVGAGAALVAVAAINLVTVSSGDGPDVVVDTGLGSDAVPYAHELTLFSTRGWLVDGPNDDSDVGAELEAARDQGARYLLIDRATANHNGFNATGLDVLAQFSGLEVAPGNDPNAIGDDDLFVSVDEHGDVDAPPCGVTPEGLPIYFERGRDLRPLAGADNLVCPARSAETYASAPVAPDPRAQAALLAELRAARRQGIREAYFQESAATSELFGGADALRGLARRAGLEPSAKLASELGDDAILVMALRWDAYDREACRRLPGDDALVLLRGAPRTLTLAYATNLYCPTRSSETFTGRGGS